MGARTHSIIQHGNDGIVIDIECHVSNNLPNIIIVGHASKAIHEARERLRGAFASSNLRLPRKRITINLAPADTPKAESGFDLAIAMSILMADGKISATLPSSTAFIGELGLDGHTRPVRGIIGKLMAGRKRGLQTFFIAVDNLEQAKLVPHITLIGVRSLAELYQHYNGHGELPSIKTGQGKHYRSVTATLPPSMSSIAGQSQAKRCLEIAAAGGHNIFMSGPPGTGKSMLAAALPSLLPTMSREEILETTQLHSLADQTYSQILDQRPLRTPHHTISLGALIGTNRPGEISLAHHGILLLDELPEFDRRCLEALRQPLESHSITLTRPQGRLRYPARFILVATGNPCPCGFYGTQRVCRCKPSQVLQYQRKLSGPILDRIDLYTQVEDVPHKLLLEEQTDHTADNLLRRRISDARNRQQERYKRPAHTNALMTNEDIRQFSNLTSAASALLTSAAKSLQLSPRTYMRSIKVARTIADLEQNDTITEAHVSEALAYRASPQEHNKQFDL